MVKKSQIRKFRSHLRGLEREIGLQLKSDTGCCGINLAHCHALLEISAEEEMSLTGLAERLELDKSTLSRTVDGMVEAGYVTRSETKGDRRRASIRVTAAGREMAERINALCDGYYSELFRRIPAEKRDAVAEAVALLASAMKEARKGGCDCGCDK